MSDKNADRLARRIVSKPRRVTIARGATTLQVSACAPGELISKDVSHIGSHPAIGQIVGVIVLAHMEATMRDDADDEEMVGCVYFLADPRTPRMPRYVGYTAHPYARFQQHAWGSHKGNPELAAWKASLSAHGLSPLFVVVEYVSFGWDAEQRLIVRLRRRGIPLFNKERPSHKARAA